MIRKSIISSIAIVCGVFVSQAQNNNVGLENTLNLHRELSIENDRNAHTGMRPFLQREVVSLDSTRNLLKTETSSAFIDRLMNKSMVEIDNENFKFEMNPIINAGMTMERADNYESSLMETSAGLQLKSSLGKKWGMELDVLYDNSEYPRYIEQQIKDKYISPGYGYTEGTGPYQSMYGQGNLTFNPSNVFSFQLGKGKHFIGDGYRSLLLSDYANSYPYFKVSAKIWNIKYTSLYTNFQEINYSDGEFNRYQDKFATIHYLSWNLTKWLNMGFFESIVWQANEGGYYRGYDIHYMNPIIFLRPVEYAQGSADNALMGTNLKLKIKKKNILYGQFMIDEFLLKEIRDGRGWWANKYGIQVGLKSYDFMWIKNLKFQAEYNVVRPYTYSYFYEISSGSTLQNYGHFNSPLAHPLGANFKEAIVRLAYYKKRWVFEGSAQVASIGFDTSGTNYGQDIYQPYNEREKEYNNTIAQGLTTDLMNTTLKVSYIVNPKSGLMFNAGVTNRIFKNTAVNSNTNFVFVGIKTGIMNRYTDN